MLLRFGRWMRVGDLSTLRATQRHQLCTRGEFWVTTLLRLFFCIFICVITGCIFGCGSTISANTQKVFTYDFTVKGKSQADLWQNALLFFTEDYVDDSVDLSVMDENEGIIVGYGSAPWKFGVYDQSCLIDYHIRCAVKYERARLQFELIEGVPAGSPCANWPWPSADGYDQVMSYLDRAAKKLGTALKDDIAAPK